MAWIRIVAEKDAEEDAEEELRRTYEAGKSSRGQVANILKAPSVHPAAMGRCIAN